MRYYKLDYGSLHMTFMANSKRDVGAFLKAKRGFGNRATQIYVSEIDPIKKVDVDLSKEVNCEDD